MPRQLLLDSSDAITNFNSTKLELDCYAETDSAHHILHEWPAPSRIRESSKIKEGFVLKKYREICSRINLSGA